MSYGYGAPRQKRRYNKFWTSMKKATAIWEAKNFGQDYVTQKYGHERVAQIASSIEKSHDTPGRSKTGGVVSSGPLKGRKIGNALANAPHALKAGDWLASNEVQGAFSRKGFRDGGPNDVMPMPDPNGDFPPGTFKPKTKMNLENDEEKAQGSQTEWAQPTSISALITSQLVQSQNSSANYWDQYFSNPALSGQYALDGRDSSAFGVDPRFNPTAQQAASQPMGGFGPATAMPGTAQGGLAFPAAGDPTTPTPTTPTPPVGQQPPPTVGDSPILGDKPDMPNDRLVNPWAYGQGGPTNSYGPSANYMAQATMDSLSLANAYFAPQRLDLAYQLGDMETDMRRLAVNLGRQVDDPVLQAKLYKEASQATRTLDVQQNTFAFQMAEQRRKEEQQNFQYYDQLAQQEYQTFLQNRLNEGQLELNGRIYGLNRWSIMHPPTASGGGQTAPTVPTAPNTAMQPQMAMGQYGIPAQSQGSLSGLAGSLVNGINPYTSSMGNVGSTRTIIK